MFCSFLLYYNFYIFSFSTKYVVFPSNCFLFFTLSDGEMGGGESCLLYYCLHHVAHCFCCNSKEFSRCPRYRLSGLLVYVLFMLSYVILLLFFFFVFVLIYVNSVTLYEFLWPFFEKNFSQGGGRHGLLLQAPPNSLTSGTRFSRTRQPHTTPWHPQVTHLLCLWWSDCCSFRGL